VASRQHTWKKTSARTRSAQTHAAGAPQGRSRRRRGTRDPTRVPHPAPRDTPETQSPRAAAATKPKRHLRATQNFKGPYLLRMHARGRRPCRRAADEPSTATGSPGSPLSSHASGEAPRTTQACRPERNVKGMRVGAAGDRNARCRSATRPNRAVPGVRGSPKHRVPPGKESRPPKVSKRRLQLPGCVTPPAWLPCSTRDGCSHTDRREPPTPQLGQSDHLTHMKHCGRSWHIQQLTCNAMSLKEAYICPATPSQQPAFLHFWNRDECATSTNAHGCIELGKGFPTHPGRSKTDAV
jgi:hypothetical protein